MNFAQELASKPGRFSVTPGSLIGKQLLAKGIRSILVGEGAKVETVVAQLARVLGIKSLANPLSSEPSILFNVPEYLAGKNALLFTRGEVEQAATAESKYTKISLEEIRAGLTDFGEEMVRFMELNGIESLEILTELTVPRYQKLGFSGAVYGDRLGMRGDVGSWNTVLVRIKERYCIGCFKCVIACPAEAIKLAADSLTPLAEVKKTGWKRGENTHPNRVEIETEDCKGCKLCLVACGEKRDVVEVVKKDA